MKVVKTFPSKAQSGFTLIELIVVIVILGILAATALPRFTDLGADARLAKIQGARAALQSAAAIVHATWLTKGSAGTTVVLEGSTTINVTAAGYPTGAGMLIAAGGLSDYVTTNAAGVLTVTADDAHAACLVTYTEATAAVSNAPLLTACD